MHSNSYSTVFIFSQQPKPPLEPESINLHQFLVACWAAQHYWPNLSLYLCPVLPTFSHYDVSPAFDWSCFTRFYLGWSNQKKCIFSSPSSLAEICSTRELLRIAEALALLSKTHLKSLHCLLSKEWDQSASNKEGAMIQTNCHKGYLNKAWRTLQRTICVQVVGTFLAYLRPQSSGHCKPIVSKNTIQ